jgi:hypothetical protein
MFSPLRNRFGVSGVIAVIALVFAMVGGAWAAQKYVITSTKQIKPSVLKALKGSAGAPGPAGANGTNGAQGLKGDPGAPGSVGKDGINGKTVLHGTGAPTNATGAEGDFYINTTTDEIFGPKGASSWPTPGTKLKGEDGSPWTAGGTLPPGESETGAWSALTGAGSIGLDSISFNIPLTAPIEELKVHAVARNATGGTECLSGTAAEPKAAPGHLCVYIGGGSATAAINSIKQPELGAELGAGPTGAVITTTDSAPAKTAWGTWAVTECPASPAPCP